MQLHCSRHDLKCAKPRNRFVCGTPEYS